MVDTRSTSRLPRLRHRQKAVSRSESESDSDSVSPTEPQPLDNSSSALQNAVKTLLNTHQGVVSTASPLRSQWRTVIREYCRGAAASAFPAWALGKIGEMIINDCLKHEFGQVPLEDIWRRRHPALSNEMADWLGFVTPETLALLFGADETRTPSNRTLRVLFTAVKPAGTNDSADTFLADVYPRIVDNWCRRLGLGLDDPADRRRSILARSPYAAYPATRNSRLSPRDFAFLKAKGEQDWEEDDDEAEGEEEQEERSRGETGVQGLEMSPLAGAKSDSPVSNAPPSALTPDNNPLRVSLEWDMSFDLAEDRVTPTDGSGHLFRGKRALGSDLQSLEPKRVRVESLQTVSPSGNISEEELSVSPFDNISEEDMQRVSNSGRWLNDTIVYTLIQCFTAATFACSGLSYACVDPLALSPIDARSRDEIIYNFLRHNGNHVDRILAGLNTDNMHWSLLCIDIPAKVCTVYDSISNSGALQKAQTIAGNLTSLISENATTTTVTSSSCPQQMAGDTANCGVYTCAAACMLTYEVNMPKAADPGAWRCAFRAILTGTTLRSCLDPNLLQVVDDVTEGSRFASPVDPPPEAGLARARWLIDQGRRRADALIAACIDTYTQRCLALQELLDRILYCLQRLHHGMRQEAQHLEKVLEELKDGEEKWRSARDAAILQTAATATAATEHLKRLGGVRKAYDRRLRFLKSALAAFDKLELDGLEKELQRSLDGYRKLLDRAEGYRREED